MLWLIIILLLILVAFALYCCACNTTPYDREADDEQQMEYLRQYKESHKKLGHSKDKQSHMDGQDIANLGGLSGRIGQSAKMEQAAWLTRMNRALCQDGLICLPEQTKRSLPEQAG